MARIMLIKNMLDEIQSRTLRPCIRQGSVFAARWLIQEEDGHQRECLYNFLKA
jgi:hypothetical protein